MRFQKGQGGRPKGATNKLTGSFKRAVLLAFERRGGVDGLVKWAEENQTEFYKICARLIPTEVAVSGKGLRPLVIDHVTSRAQLAAAIGAQHDDREPDDDGDDPVH